MLSSVHIVTSGGFTQFDASDWATVGEETDGLSEHRWLRRPDDVRLWLYKPVEIKDGHRQGEDWAEKTVSEIAELLGVPAAAIDLALRQGQEGLVSRDIKPEGWDLQPGAALLGGLVPDYESRTKFREGHNIENIALALADLRPPPDRVDLQGLDAYDTFCGYLVIDALVANRDRHDHNWAVLIPPGHEPARLAPSFDHASSLGFNVTDEERQRRLHDASVDDWARRGTAYRFEHQAPASSVETLVDLAVRALQKASPQAQQRWSAAVRSLSLSDVVHILSDIPMLSEAAATFAVRLVEANQNRLLERWDQEEGES